jgi:hypothetical protein
MAIFNSYVKLPEGNSHVTAAPAEWHGRFKDFDLSKGTTDAKASAGQQRDATVSLW